jgi:hypothetical protein
MCAQFSVIQTDGHHETAGFTGEDVLRQAQVWLLDEHLEPRLSEGVVFATRLATPEGFSFSIGPSVRLDRDLIEELEAEMTPLCRKPIEEVANDRRFAQAVYRLAIERELDLLDFKYEF